MKVVLAIDGSECSDAAVHTLIDQLVPGRTEVRVCHAIEWGKDLPPFVSFAAGPAAASDVVARHDRLCREAEGLVARTAARLSAAGFPVSTDIRNGEPRQTIIECAREIDADLILVGSHGRTGMQRMLLGSVAYGVVHDAPCSVQVVRRRADA